MPAFQWIASILQFVALSCQLWVLHARSKRMFTYAGEDSMDAVAAALEPIERELEI